MTSRTEKAIVYEDGAVTFLARILDDDGNAIQREDIATVTCRVTNADDVTQFTTPTIDVASTVFNSYSMLAWTKDKIGWNFKSKQAGSIVPDGNRIYQVEFIFTPVAGDPYPVVYQLQTQELFSS